MPVHADQMPTICDILTVTEKKKEAFFLLYRSMVGKPSVVGGLFLLDLLLFLRAYPAHANNNGGLG